jgi:hypothetical protein
MDSSYAVSEKLELERRLAALKARKQRAEADLRRAATEATAAETARARQLTALASLVSIICSGQRDTQHHDAMALLSLDLAARREVRRTLPTPRKKPAVRAVQLQQQQQQHSSRAPSESHRPAPLAAPQTVAWPTRLYTDDCGNPRWARADALVQWPLSSPPAALNVVVPQEPSHASPLASPNSFSSEHGGEEPEWKEPPSSILRSSPAIDEKDTAARPLTTAAVRTHKAISLSPPRRNNAHFALEPARIAACTVAELLEDIVEDPALDSTHLDVIARVIAKHSASRGPQAQEKDPFPRQLTFEALDRLAPVKPTQPLDEPTLPVDWRVTLHDIEGRIDPWDGSDAASDNLPSVGDDDEEDDSAAIAAWLAARPNRQSHRGDPRTLAVGSRLDAFAISGL